MEPSETNKRPAQSFPPPAEPPEKINKKDMSILAKDIFFLDNTTGESRCMRLGSQEDYTRLLIRSSVRCLVDSDGCDIYSFSRLEDQAQYQQGPPLLRHQLASAPVVSIKPYPYQDLPPSHQVQLPIILADEPQFICEDGWMASLADKVVQEFLAYDDSRPGIRVRSMALVGCSRSGKKGPERTMPPSRCLYPKRHWPASQHYHGHVQ